jgi:multicomponent Na+:H+ antiporter subunit F
MAAAIFILVVTAAGLLRIFRSSAPLERLMAAQLLGTGGTAVLLLIGVALDEPAMMDVALLMTLFAAFSSVGFVYRPMGQVPPQQPER